MFIFFALAFAFACPDEPGQCKVWPVTEKRCDRQGTRECLRNVWYDIGDECYCWWDKANFRAERYEKILTTEWKCRIGRQDYWHPYGFTTSLTPASCPKNMVAVKSTHGRHVFYGGPVNSTYEPDLRTLCRTECPFGTGYEWTYFHYYGRETALASRRKQQKWWWWW